MFKMSAFSVDTGQQTTPPLVDGVVQFAPHGDQTLTQLVDVLDYAVVHTLQVPFCTFFSATAVQNLLKSVKI